MYAVRQVGTLSRLDFEYVWEQRWGIARTADVNGTFSKFETFAEAVQAVAFATATDPVKYGYEVEELNA